jgi:hypothetical protein
LISNARRGYNTALRSTSGDVMNTATAEKLGTIKRAIAAMIQERQSTSVEPVFRVNELWRNFDRFMEYVRYLPVEQLENIRAHTGMAFFANVWHMDYHDGRRIRTDAEAAEHPLVKRYIAHSEGLPERFQCTEPRTNDLIGQIGINYGKRLVNHDIVREQACIANLYNLGVLAPLAERRCTVIELGSGYGQLAHQISRGLSGSCYVCVDYPESLFWSAVFLAVNNDPDSIFIYDPAASKDLDLAALAARYRFIMLPNYLCDRLGELQAIDLIINQNSMQEMTEDQARHYLQLFSRGLTGWIYSYNANRQFMNFELKTLIFDMLGEYFAGEPAASFYDDFYGRDSWHLTDQKYLFLGRRKDGPMPPRRMDASGMVWISGRRARIDAGQRA